MEQPEKELIQEIKNLFEDYEEAYVPGEWESFSAAREKKYPFFGVWIKVAAILFLIISVLPYRINDLYLLKKPAELTKLKLSSDPVRAALPLNMQSPVSNDNRIVVNRRGKSVVPVNGKVGEEKPVAGKQGHIIVAQLFRDTAILKNKKEMLAAKAGPEPAISGSAMIAANSPLAAQRIPAQPVLSKDSAALSKKEKPGTMEFLIAESKSASKTKLKTSQPSKWDFGVEVAPNMTRTNVNIGGGLTTAYRLSDKFSLSSGVSLLQLESGIDIPASGRQAKMSISSLSSRELLAIDANIKAIDIPLAVVYHVNKHFYTSAGISYFNVISEKRNNTYEQTSQVSQTVTDPETGFSSFDRVVVSQSVSEPAVESRLKGNSYLGFFNFSIGRRQSLFNKYNVLIEPFIKVPLGKLSAEDLKLTNSGLKFQISF